MSGGTPCICGERSKPVASRDWVVTMRYHNRSAFNGYRVTWSDYSEVSCRRCRALWRTKAAYVDALPDGVL